jgi:hypothetical protein
MMTFLVLPKVFMVLDNSSTITSTTFLSHDEPGLVWRTAGATNNYLTVQLESGSINVVALVGSNLAAGDTVRVRLGSSQAQVEGGSAPIDYTTAIAAGTSQNESTFVIDKLDAPVSYTFARIDFTSVSASYVEVGRLVIGEAVEALGIDVNAEFTFENDTADSYFPYDTKPSWKVTFSGLKDSEFWNEWGTNLRKIANKRGFLFVPDLSNEFVQQQTIWGFVSAMPKSTLIACDYSNVELTIKSLI